MRWQFFRQYLVRPECCPNYRLWDSSDPRTDLFEDDIWPQALGCWTHQRQKSHVWVDTFWYAHRQFAAYLNRQKRSRPLNRQLELGGLACQWYRPLRNHQTHKVEYEKHQVAPSNTGFEHKSRLVRVCDWPYILDRWHDGCGCWF